MSDDSVCIFTSLQDVSNANVRNGNNGKPAVAKRSNGIKTRSMSIGNSANNDVVLAPAPRPTIPGAFSNRPNGARGAETFARGRALAEPNSYQMTGNADDIDERDKDDVLCTTEYVAEMYQWFSEKEVSTSVRPIYMENQPHINQRMRAILIDWLVEVHAKFKLIPETLYLTINLIDRYLEQEPVTRNKLQLIGVTALLIASKYEEIYPPELRDLVYICKIISACSRLFQVLRAQHCCTNNYSFLFRVYATGDRAYTRSEIVEAETKMLKTLEYNITVPSAHAFLVRFLKAGHADKRIVQLSCFLLDGTLQCYDLLKYLPSQLAAAVVFIARRHVGRNGWSPTLLNYSNYCEEEVIPVARAILKAKQTASSELKAVAKKYASTRYGQVSNTTIVADF
jgi:G2/mitotic-specific cyclin-B, other